MPTPRAKREGKVMPAICELQGLRVGGGEKVEMQRKMRKPLPRAKSITEIDD